MPKKKTTHKYYLVCYGFDDGEHAIDVLKNNTEARLYKNMRKAKAYIQKRILEYRGIYGNSVLCNLEIVSVQEDGFLSLPSGYINNYRCGCGRKKRRFAFFCPLCSIGPQAISYFIQHEVCRWDPTEWLQE